MTERIHFHFSLSCIGEGNGNPLQCSCLENPRDRGAWWAAAYGVAQSQTQLKRLGSSSRTTVQRRQGFSDSSMGKESACNAGDASLIPGSGRFSQEGISYPLQYSWASLVVPMVKKSAYNAGDLGLIPGLRRSPGGGHGNPLQCSCLENPRERGAWWAAAYGVAQSRTRLKRLSSSMVLGSVLVSFFYM